MSPTSAGLDSNPGSCGQNQKPQPLHSTQKWHLLLAESISPPHSKIQKIQTVTSQKIRIILWSMNTIDAAQIFSRSELVFLSQTSAIWTEIMGSVVMYVHNLGVMTIEPFCSRNYSQHILTFNIRVTATFVIDHKEKMSLFNHKQFCL